MSNGHTQGPWRIDHDGSNWMVVTDDYPDMVDVWGFGGMSKDEAAANARLIAAAPDLYQHAEALLADVMQRYGITADGLTCPHMRGLAEAIAKARGTPC